MSDEAIERLCAGILRQAATDYIRALNTDNKAQAQKLERFFTSGWGELLSNGHGDAIISACRRRANAR